MNQFLLLLLSFYYISFFAFFDSFDSISHFIRYINFSNVIDTIQGILSALNATTSGFSLSSNIHPYNFFSICFFFLTPPSPPFGNIRSLFYPSMAPECGTLSPSVSFANSFSPLSPFLFDFLTNLYILFYVVYVSPCFWKSVCYFLSYCEIQSLFTFFTF